MYLISTVAETRSTLFFFSKRKLHPWYERPKSSAMLKKINRLPKLIGINQARGRFVTVLPRTDALFYAVCKLFVLFVVRLINSSTR